MTSQTVNMSGVQNVDAILSGVRWAGTVLTYGFTTQASDYGNNYAWRLDHDDNPSTPAVTVNETTRFQAFNADQIAAAEAAFAEFRALTAMSALQQEPAGGADIRLAESASRDPTNTTAYASYPGNDARDGDAWFNTTDYNTPRLGTYAYQTMFHEIGHALGLKHGHEADNGNSTVLSSDRDSLEFSTMTYRAHIGHSAGGYGVTAGHYPQSFMMLDIAALQYMYGADFSTNSGNTTYKFDPATGQMFVNGTSQGIPRNDAGANVNVIFRTIWDGNGIDTYDFSAYAAGRQLLIDLAPGAWTDVDSDSNFQAADLRASNPGTQMARGQVFNALMFNGDTRSLIENAIGGAGDDRIKGNQANNVLIGGLGRDILEGFDGNDTLDAGPGNSEMYGGNGTDHIWAGQNTDYIDGGNGYDLVDYSRSTSEIQIDTTIGKVVGGWATGDTLIGIEYVTATAFDDNVRMGNENNVIRAGGGADALDGNGGSDILYGEDGNDTLRGGAGGDGIYGGAGFDIASFGSAVTINLATGVHGGEAAGDFFDSIEQYNGSAEADAFYASNGAGARFAGGDGIDYFYGGTREDWLQGGKGGDYINGGGGSDTVSYADAPNGITAEMYFDADTTLGRTEGKITAGEWGLDTLVSVENVEGSNHADRLYGDERSNTLSGLGGDDYIEGDGGGTPQGSYDYLMGGAGNDTIVIGIFDTAIGGPDFDTASFVGGPINLNFTTNTFTVGGQGIYLREFESYVGTTGADVVYGAAHGEHINLGAGNDTLAGQGGDDFLYTGAGADWMDGGAGRDTMVFHKAMVADWQSGVLDPDIGSDSWLNWEVIQGSAGDDRIRTNSWGFAVELRGGAGNDVLAAGVNGVVADTLLGEAGNDYLDGGAGADWLGGGAGNDTYALGADTSDRITDASGIDTITSTISRSLAGYAMIENLTLLGAAALAATGNALNNVLTGNAAANALSGGAGNDTLIGGAGRDTLSGGVGNDTYVLAADASDIVSDAGGIDTITSTISRSLAGYATIENLTLLGAAALVATGNALNNVLTGNAAANALAGGAGNDTLIGGAGRDTLNGGVGNDTYVLAADTTDVIFDAGGIDTITSTISRSLGGYATVENLTLLGAAALNGAGNALNNVLTGNMAANTLSGGNGNDILSGGAGRDTLLGGNGNDIYALYADVTDVVSDASGIDTIGTTITRSLSSYSGIENLTLWGASAINGTGNGANNVLTGNSANNTLSGGGGNDTLIGGAGRDTLDGGAGNDIFHLYAETTDVILDASGLDTITSTISRSLASYVTVENLTLLGSAGINGAGNALNNIVTGNAAANVLSGGAGNDTLVGGAGNDTLEGGVGNDMLRGVSGADKFVFRQAQLSAANADHIVDFGPDDFIYFDVASGPTGALAATAFCLGANALDADDRFVYYAPHKSLYFDQDGSGAASKVLVAVFGNGFAPTASDIILV